MLAYANAYSVEIPADGVSSLVARHQNACAAVGPAVCQVTGSSLERQGRDRVHATLPLRAAPAWLAGFRGRLAKDAEDPGGRMVQANVSSEDLSRQDAVENLFSVLTRRRIRRGVFKPVVDLQAAINRYLKEHNQAPKPFVWTKPADEIPAKLDRLPVPSV